MEYGVLILGLGSYIVYLSFFSFQPELLILDWGIPIYASMGLAVLNLLLPMDLLNKKLFKMPKDEEIFPSYESVEQKF